MPELNEFEKLLDRAEALVRDINKYQQTDPESAAIINEFIGEWINKQEAIEQNGKSN